MRGTYKCSIWVGVALWLFLNLTSPVLAQYGGQYGEFCDVCGHRLGGTVYLLTDRISGQKKQVCGDCEFKLPACFLCGLPTLTNVVETVHLPDGRILCARDARTAVYREQEGIRVCQDVKEALQRQFSRFLSFPATNISFEMIDRIHLQALFRVSGNDYQCPNVWGHTVSTAKNGRCEHHVSVMSGLPFGWFQTTCAHEFTHAWIFENVPAARKRTLSNPAEEGFCELLAYMFADSLGDENAKSNILANAYTRGQIQVFVDTEKQFGVNEIIDWMKFGTDDRLDAANLGRVRDKARRPLSASGSWPPEKSRNSS